ncbi:helix-turn-helix domain-containing protein [Herbidospora sp. NBRC 101105]|uniref:winged helix-turn-helix transcriptional regulator n=1 Tax=Herbidospora sp. NBRC 101105 TaxID=3032195 RepID=UPI0024A12831|nr:helix-turn-helix domain-containing protein [Herbidospora sp. NBRC 101105]GLX96189.1 ArsR family transcriptional regulator [Herbidospora sp. NBRC 101105]
MTLPSTYADRNCSLARALEVVGERWTLLIVRDAFFGVRRFGDFATQLKIPRAVLTNRLKLLVREGVLTREEGATVEYRLTPKGVELWPVVRTLMSWGDTHYSPGGARRAVRHDGDGGLLDPAGRCERCGELVPVTETRVEPGPGFDPADQGDDPVSDAINTPRRLLEPIG